LTKEEILYMKDSLADIKAGRYTISAKNETAESLLVKLKAHPKSFCEKCYHNKEAHAFGGCAYCNCKGFVEKKKELSK